MGAITAATAIGLGAQGASAGMSFYQASQQRKLQLEAQASARKYMEEARKRLEVNYMDSLSIIKEPYELEREALLSSGAQAMEAARESQRGVAGTAGRLQMAQNVGQGQIRSAMGQELMGLERMSAVEDSRLRDENVMLDLGEVQGSQLKEANAFRLGQAALFQGMQGLSSLGTKVAGLTDPDFSKANLPTGEGSGQMTAPGTNQPQVGGQYNIGAQGAIAPEMNGKALNPAYQGMTMEQVISKLQEQGQISPQDLTGNKGYVDNLIYQLIYQ
jgi:hypothetical protein